MKNQKIKQSTKNLKLWVIAWTLSTALATFGPKFIWEGQAILTALGILLNTAIGAGMILSNIRHLKSMDELQRKIHLDAMGIALGVGVVGGLSYSMMDTTNLIANNAEISHLVILISLTYMAGILIGNKQYK